MDLELTEHNQPRVVALPTSKGPVWPGRSAGPGAISFDRQELRDIFNLYGRKVANGEWRDYAIAATAQKAVFSVYRRFAEFPLYRIEKVRGPRKQAAYCVIAATGLILRRGHDLKRVISVLDKKLTVVSG